MTSAELLAAVRALKGVRVLVLGDVIADRYQFGNPTRVSREAPVLVLEQAGDATVPGGAANAAGNVRSLGGVVELAGVVGDDLEGELLRGQLRTLGVDGDGLVVEAGRPTTTKTRIVAGRRSRGQQVVRLDRASREPLQPGTREGLRARTLSLLGNVDALLISEYGYGALEPALVNEAITAAREHGTPVVVDTQADLSIYRGATVVTPNLAELETWNRASLRTAGEVETAAGRLREEIGAGAVLCTQGSEGMTLVTAERSWAIPVARRAEVFDFVGAGDTVAATVALCLGAGLEPLLAALMADCSASVVVQKPGAATCAPAELRGAIRHLDPATLEAVAS